jgi:hypothetical protein
MAITDGYRIENHTVFLGSCESNSFKQPDPGVAIMNFVEAVTSGFKR